MAEVRLYRSIEDKKRIKNLHTRFLNCVKNDKINELRNIVKDNKYYLGLYDEKRHTREPKTGLSVIGKAINAAVYFKRTEILKYLLELEGYDADEYNAGITMAMIQCARTDDVRTFNLLTLHPYESNGADFITVLQMAIIYNSENIVEQLIFHDHPRECLYMVGLREAVEKDNNHMIDFITLKIPESIPYALIVAYSYDKKHLVKQLLNYSYSDEVLDVIYMGAIRNDLYDLVKDLTDLQHQNYYSMYVIDKAVDCQRFKIADLLLKRQIIFLSDIGSDRLIRCMNEGYLLDIPIQNRSTNYNCIIERRNKRNENIRHILLKNTSMNSDVITIISDFTDFSDFLYCNRIN